MLRESAIAFGYAFNMAAIGNRSVNARIPGGQLILDLVDAVFASGDIASARQAVVDELGAEALVDAVGVYANFEMMNRLAEGTGIPIPGAALSREAEMVEILGLNRFLKH